MRRGIIVEKNKKCITLLTPDGQFLRTKNEQQDYEIGQEVTFPNESRLDRKRAGFFDLLRLRPLFAGILSIAAIIVVIFTMMPSFSGQKAYAYMTIDINPSFELKLDDNYQVIGVTPLNSDAKQVLGNIKDWEKADMTKVVQKIIDDCDEKGYINQSKSIYIATVYENKQDHTYKTNVKNKINTISGEYEKRDYTLETIEGDLETREKAQKAGISTGSYMRNQEDNEKEDVKKDQDAEDQDADQEEPKQDDEEQADKQEQEKVKPDENDESHPNNETPNEEEKEQKDIEREEQRPHQKPHQLKPDDETKGKKGHDEKDNSSQKEQKKNQATDPNEKKHHRDKSGPDKHAQKESGHKRPNNEQH